MSILSSPNQQISHAASSRPHRSSPPHQSKASSLSHIDKWMPSIYFVAFRHSPSCRSSSPSANPQPTNLCPLPCRRPATLPRQDSNFSLLLTFYHKETSKARKLKARVACSVTDVEGSEVCRALEGRNIDCRGMETGILPSRQIIEVRQSAV